MVDLTAGLTADNETLRLSREYEKLKLSYMKSLSWGMRDTVKYSMVGFLGSVVGDDGMIVHRSNGRDRFEGYMVLVGVLSFILTLLLLASSAPLVTYVLPFIASPYLMRIFSTVYYAISGKPSGLVTKAYEWVFSIEEESEPPLSANLTPIGEDELYAFSKEIEDLTDRYVGRSVRNPHIRKAVGGFIDKQRKAGTG